MKDRVTIGPDEVKAVLGLLLKRHRLHLRPGERLAWSGTYNHGEAHLTLTLSDAEEEAVLTIEGRIDLEANDIQDPSEGKEAVMDFIDEALQEFFSSGRSWRPPLDWSAYEGAGEVPTMWLRGDLVNLKLERMADALLEGSDL